MLASIGTAYFATERIWKFEHAAFTDLAKFNAERDGPDGLATSVHTGNVFRFHVAKRIQL